MPLVFPSKAKILLRTFKAVLTSGASGVIIKTLERRIMGQGSLMAQGVVDMSNFSLVGYWALVLSSLRCPTLGTSPV